MEKLYIKLTTIIFVSAILVNPATSSTTQSDTNTTEESTTQSVATGAEQSPTITTNTPLSAIPTQPIIPVNIGGSCNDSDQCKQVDQNIECINNTCKCMKTFFKWNETNCAKVNYLKPSSLLLTSTETKITVAWTGPSGLPSIYHIVYNIDIKGDNYMDNKTTEANETEFGGLTAGKIYTVFVLSVVNETIKANEINDTQWTRPYPPDCPPNTANYKSPNITVTWSKPSGEVDGYNITFNGISYKSTTLTLHIYNTEPGVNYTMTLQSYVGNDQLSTVATCYIRTESEEPDAPRNATLDGDPAQNNFNISVEEPDSPRGDIVSYTFILHSKNYTDQEYMFYMNETKPVTMDNKYFISGLTPGTYYSVQVFTVNDAFPSETSFSISRDIRTAEDKPGKVANLTFTSSLTSVNVTWMRPGMPNGDIIGYIILIVPDNGECRAYIQESSTNAINSSCGFVERTTINLNQMSMSQNILNLKASAYYPVKVFSYTSVGIGEKSDINVTTNIAAPFKPTNPQGKASSSKSIKVNWTKPTKRTGPTTYKVTVRDVILGTNSSKTCESDNFDTTHCTVNNLKEYWPYNFQVTAVVKDGERIVGMNSSGISSNVTTQQGVPGKVKKFTYSLEDSGCRASLHWFTPAREDRNGIIVTYQITISGSSKLVEDNDPQPYNPDTKSFDYTIVLKKGSIINVEIKAINTKSKPSASSDLEINTQDCFEPLSGGEVAGIVICVLLLLVAIVLAGVIVYRRWDIISKYVICGGDDERFEPLRPMIEQNRPIVLNSIKAFLAKYHADDNRLFIAEYEDLKTLSSRHPTNAAIVDENKPKNRYVNILPYDHSRVILAPTEDEDTSDYINANYIPGYTYGKEFIASQGPLPGTANDFWRMIWEQSVSIIVMLTKCSENNMDKCEHYWPHQANEPKCYDDLMVNVTSISNMGKYDITIMDLCFGDETRVIKHFHFLEWPDFSARVETTTLIDFISTVRSHITPDIKGPTVTHCSAGVGRTGTFITVDYLMQYVRDNDLSSEVDIFDWVLQMRDHRTTMVQTYTQYAFIHDCLSDIVERKKKSLQRDSHAVNGELEMDNLAFEDDLYENTKLGVALEKTEL